MGNLCNCFLPAKNIEEDAEFDYSKPSKEVPRSKTRNENNYEMIYGHKRYSYESCEDRRESIRDDVFTISNSFPSPIRNADAETSGKMYEYGFLNSIESNFKLYATSAAVQNQRRTRIWSLRPDSFLHSSTSLTPKHIRINFTSERDECMVSSSCSSLLLDDKKEQFSISESFDSGFISSGVAIEMCSPPSPVNVFSQAYVVIEQTNTRKSVFHYLFDLSTLIRDALFEWPADYVRRIKQSVSKLTGHRGALKWRAAKRPTKEDQVPIVMAHSNDFQTNIVDKPFSIMGLLSKFNLFNLFRVAAVLPNSQSTVLFGFNPLRDLLNLLNINFL